MINLAYDYQDGVASQCMRLYLDENTDGMWAELEGNLNAQYGDFIIRVETA